MNKYLEPVITVFALAFIAFGFYLMWQFHDRLNYIDSELRSIDEGQIVTVPDYMGGGGTTEIFVSERDTWNRLEKVINLNHLKD
jgi:hypothetical protein